MRYIENSGWNDYVYRKVMNGNSSNEGDPQDFSDDAYERSHIMQFCFNHMLLVAIKGKI